MDATRQGIKLKRKAACTRVEEFWQCIYCIFWWLADSEGLHAGLAFGLMKREYNSYDDEDDARG